MKKRTSLRSLHENVRMKSCREIVTDNTYGHNSTAEAQWSELAGWIDSECQRPRVLRFRRRSLDTGLGSEVDVSVDALLTSIEREKGVRFNFSLINSLILRFLDHQRLHTYMPIEPLFRFAKALPLTLISGYIYLEKYIDKIKGTFSDCSLLVKFFFVCCLIGSKFVNDIHADAFLTGCSIALREVNYIEGLVLSTINYDIEISGRDVRRVLEDNALPGRRNLDIRFQEICRNTHH